MAKGKRGRPRKVSEVIEDENILNNDENEVVEETTEEQDTSSEQQNDFEGTQNHHNPFQESVVERDYSTPKVAQGEVEDIGEPTFVPPSYEDIVQDRQSESFDDGYNENPFDNPNPALNDLDNKDKKIACESLVDTCLDAYEQLHKYAQHIVKVDEEELMQKQAEDKIDLEQIIPVTENGDSMSVGEFIGQFNQQSQQALKYDKEFGFKVRPAMIRVFMKKGWGMSDEQFLLYMFGKDIAIKVGIMYQLKKSINTTISTLEKAHKRQKQQSRGYSEIVEEEHESTPIQDDDDDYNVEFEPSDTQTEEQPIIIEEEPSEEFTTSMDINMPQNPKNPMAQHPKEVRKEIGRKKGTKKKK